MNREKAFQALNALDDRYIAEALRYAPEGAAGASERSASMKSKRIVTLALAAALILALGAAAWAIGLSIHRQRQQELRQELQVDENRVEDYVEYPVPEDPEQAPESGVTLLSAMNDGEFQNYWVVLNGVTPEMVERMAAPILEDRDGSPLGENDHRYCWLYCGWDGESWYDVWPEGGHNAQGIRDAYDPETCTLTVRTAITIDRMPERAELRFIIVDTIDYGDAHVSDGELVWDLGSVSVERTGQTLRTVWFTEPVSFENGDYGGGEFLGMELSASGVNWILRHDGVSEMYHPHEFASEEERQEYLALEQSWLQAIDELERTAVLHFADGSSMAVNPPLSSEPAGDRVKDKCIFGHTIDPSQVVGVTLGGRTFEIP